MAKRQKYKIELEGVIVSYLYYSSNHLIAVPHKNCLAFCRFNQIYEPLRGMLDVAVWIVGRNLTRNL